jgi:hypothetical protein
MSGGSVDRRGVRRWVWAVAVLVVVLGSAVALAALLQTQPLVDPSSVDRFAYGPQGGSIRDFPVFTRKKDGAQLEQILADLNAAPVVGSTAAGVVARDKSRVLLVLFRKDGLMYFVYPGSARYVGISEADEQYLGTLDSPALASLLDEFARASGASAVAATATLAATTSSGATASVVPPGS